MCRRFWRLRRLQRSRTCPNGSNFFTHTRLKASLSYASHERQCKSALSLGIDCFNFLILRIQIDVRDSIAWSTCIGPLLQVVGNIPPSGDTPRTSFTCMCRVGTSCMLPESWSIQLSYQLCCTVLSAELNTASHLSSCEKFCIRMKLQAIGVCSWRWYVWGTCS